VNYVLSSSVVFGADCTLDNRLHCALAYKRQVARQRKCFAQGETRGKDDQAGGFPVSTLG